jgi:hypothetical protein
LSEVLARTFHDSVLSGASIARLNYGAVRGLPELQRLRRALPTRVHVYPIIALAVAMTFIVINALTLQRERHPAPFFVESDSIPATAAKLQPERPAPSAAAENFAPSHASPSARASESGSRPEPNSNLRPIDPIAEKLRSEASKETQRLWANAQSALIKLGYSIRIGEPGNAGALAALRDFEKAHGLPISNEVTPRLVKLLAAAVNSSASR